MSIEQGYGADVIYILLHEVGLTSDQILQMFTAGLTVSFGNTEIQYTPEQEILLRRYLLLEERTKKFDAKSVELAATLFELEKIKARMGYSTDPSVFSAIEDLERFKQKLSQHHDKIIHIPAHMSRVKYLVSTLRRSGLHTDVAVVMEIEEILGRVESYLDLVEKR